MLNFEDEERYFVLKILYLGDVFLYFLKNICLFCLLIVYYKEQYRIIYVV